MIDIALPQAAFRLDAIDVAAPCEAEWDEMSPLDASGRVRHCAQCRLNVYNISEMSRADAEALIRSREGRLCVRFYRRADGTILTQDCPRGLAKLRAAARRARARVAATVAAALGLGASAAALARIEKDSWRWLPKVRDQDPHSRITRALVPGAPPPGGAWVAGDVCY